MLYERNLISMTEISGMSFVFLIYLEPIKIPQTLGLTIKRKVEKDLPERGNYLFASSFFRLARILTLCIGHF